MGLDVLDLDVDILRFFSIRHICSYPFKLLLLVFAGPGALEKKEFFDPDQRDKICRPYKRLIILLVTIKDTSSQTVDGLDMCMVGFVVLADIKKITILGLEFIFRTFREFDDGM